MYNRALSEEEKQFIKFKFDELENIYASNYSSKEINRIHEAYNISLAAHENKRRLTGDPYIIHSIEIAKIVAGEMQLGPTSVICALLHDVTKYSDITLADITQQFGKNVADIIGGLRKIEGLYTKKVSLHADNFIQLLLNLSDDVRIILLKIADRLDSLRTLSVVEESVRRMVAAETAILYAPIAHRLGLYNIKTELEELSMKYSEPEIYNSIEIKLQQTRKNLDKYIELFIQPIKEDLEIQGFDFEIKGRIKTISSIWKKMQQQNVELTEVYDLFAIRIILDSKLELEKEDCWKVYSVITNWYKPNTKRLRDWISSPKSTGYESLHTTVVGPEGRWVEVQIRTTRMDTEAEMGYAAHWKYKKKGGKSEEPVDWLLKIREILERKNHESDKIDKVKGELYSDNIFVFTPDGDLKKLSAGATVLDFAYSVHSKVGDSCTGGKVNGKIVQLKEKLNNGDQIEIRTSKNQKPKLDWLLWVSSSRARAKIKRALKVDEYKEANLGKELLKRKLQQLKVTFNDEVIRDLVKHFEVKNLHELYQNIAIEKIEMFQIKDYFIDKATVTKQSGRPTRNDIPHEIKPKIGKSGSMLVIDNNPQLRDFNLSKCCNPVPGDNVFGFVTVNKGINIHRTNCPNSTQMREKYGYRIIKANWAEQSEISGFNTKINITGKDQVGMLNQVSTVISNDYKVNIKSLNVTSNNNLFEGEIELFLKDAGHLDVIINKLLKIKGIIKVQRIT